DDPINQIDPSGNIGIFDTLGSLAIEQINLRTSDVKALQRARKIAGQLCHISAIMVVPLNAAYDQIRKLTKGSFFQSHHVARNADMRDLFLDAYERGLGFAIPLLGNTGIPGSTHG